MFELQNQQATITSVNLRKELHGDERVGAVDIGFTMTAPNTLLAQLDPQLVGTFYQGAASGQGELDGRLPDLRFPHLAMPIKWDYVGVGYEVALGYGMNDDRELRFIGCQIDKFKLDLKAGGSVDISLRVIAHPAEEDVGELYELLGGEVALSLMAPEAGKEGDEPEQAAMFGEQPEEEETEGPYDDDRGEQEQLAPVDLEADDTTYAEAVMLVQAQKAPRADYIRRKLKITASLAEEYLQRMEDEGIVTAADHSGQRTVIEMEPA